MSVRPVALTLVSVSHSSLRATGSIPVVGSSRNTMGGSPIRAMAVLTFRLFPPLQKVFHMVNISTDGLSTNFTV